uniref:designed cortisol-binding protein hcy129_mpnn5 n=1 Tax=synthetic construct TaxID=32630 RepID=UPI00383BF761
MSGTSSEEAKEAIIAMLKEWYDAMNEGDMEKLRSLVDPDASFVDARTNQVYDKDQFLQMIKEALEQDLKVEVKSIDIEQQPDGDVVIVKVKVRATMVRNGQEHVFEVVDTYEFRRKGDSWKIVKLVSEITQLGSG